VLLHSDRGTQFTSSDYQRFLADHNITSSMSGVGHCGDNAAAEGFFGLIKRERIHRRRYLSLAAARSDVFDYIERFRDDYASPSPIDSGHLFQATCPGYPQLTRPGSAIYGRLPGHPQRQRRIATAGVSPVVKRPRAECSGVFRPATPCDASRTQPQEPCKRSGHFDWQGIVLGGRVSDGPQPFSRPVPTVSFSISNSGIRTLPRARTRVREAKRRPKKVNFPQRQIAPPRRRR
jgi:hypothetical protein